MEMTILERDDKISHVVLTGRLDTTAAEQIDKHFSDATAGRNRPAIVDLSQVEFMASRGIGLLLANCKRLNKGGHKLVALNPQGLVAGVLKASKTELIMPVAHDLEEAIQIAGGGPGQAGAASPGPTRTARQEPRFPQPKLVATTATAAEAVRKVAIKNELSELVTLNAAVAEFLAAHAVPYRAAYAVNLAIEELVVNVIRYAYVDDDPHVIDVELAIEGDQIALRIDDDGMPFDPRRGPALNVHAEDRETGGLGLALVLDMVDVLKYRREEERNRVEVRIHLAAEEGGEALEDAGHAAE
jgi:serine/threonine-protein kinase RsbW